MLLTVLFVPFLLFSNALGVRLGVTPGTPIANSNVQIGWTIEHPGTSDAPVGFTILLHGPEGGPTSRHVTVNGKLSGSEEMNVGPEGSYSLHVYSDPGVGTLGTDYANGTTSFQVISPPSTAPPSNTATTASSSPPTNSAAASTTSESVTNGEAQNGDPTTLVTSTTLSGGATNSSSSNSPSNSSSSFTNSISTKPGVPAQAVDKTGTGSQIGPSSSAQSSPSPSLPSSPLSSSSPESSASSSSKRGIIIGSVLGILAFLILLATILFCLWRRRKQNSERPVTFHRDMMVRTTGPPLYTLSGEPSSGGRGISAEDEKGGYLISTMDDTASISDESGFEDQYTISTNHATIDTRPNANPFLDAEFMSRYSVSPPPPLSEISDTSHK